MIMKKHRLWMTFRSLAAALIVGFLTAGCKTTPLVTDYGMTSLLSKTSNSAVYPNSSVPLKLEVKSAAEGEIKIEYVSCNIGGTLWIDEEKILPGQFFEHDFATPLYMFFVPEQAGEAELRFRISNRVVTTEVDPLRFLVNEAAYTLQMISDTVVTVGIKENLTFAIRELQTKAASVSKAPSNKFRISGRINKGRGVLQVKDKVLDDNSAVSELIQSGIGTKSAVVKMLAETKAETASVEVAKDEETPMYYTSMAIGKNALIFDISDEYDNTVSTTVNLKAGSPAAELIATLKQDSTYKAAVQHKFTVFPDTKGADIKLSMAWAIDPTKGSITDATVTCKEAAIPAGEKVDLVCNYATPMTVLTDNTGTLGLKFQIRDQYGSNYDTTYVITVVAPTIDFSFPDISSSLSEWKPYEWTGNLPVEAGSNTYQISYKNDDPEAGVFTINGASPIDGDRTDLIPGKNTFQYVPKKPGTHNITFVVYDKFGNEKSYPVTFTVGTNKLDVTVAPVSKVNYGQSINVNVNVPSQDHIQSFVGVVSSLDGGTAAIEANGATVTENKEFALKTGTNVFKITPTKVAGEYKFKLLVRTNIGQEEAHEIVIPILLPELNARLTTLVGECDLTGTLIYELVIEEPHYTDKFTLGASIIKGADGTLTIGGKTVANNQNATISKAGTVPITFKPKTKSDVEINLRITDENGQEKTVKLTGKVDNPPLTTSTSADGRTIKYKTATPFTLTINEALHTAAFSVVPTFVKGSGILTINGKQVTPGVKIDLENGTHNCTFTPDDCGATDITFEVKDTHGAKKTVHALFTVEPYPLAFTMDNVSASEVNITVPVTFTLKIDEQEAPEGGYKLTYVADNKGTVKIGEAVFGQGTSKSLNKGTHNLSYTPTATGTHRVVFTLQDMFGQEKSVTLNLEAKNAPLEASASVGTATTYIKKAVNFTISASEANYSGVFKTTVTQTGDGTLTVNGTAVAFDKEFNMAGGNTTMAYTPNTLGEHTLNFTVKDIYGQSKEFSVKIKADYANMTATAAGPASVYVGRSAAIALSLAEDNYTANFTASYSGGSGILKNGTTTWNSGGSYPIAGGSTNLTYTPATTGAHTLNFTFKDSYGQTKTAVVTIQVTQAPLTVSATPASATVYTNTTATSTLAVSEAEHPSQFTAAATISGSGSLTINGSAVGNGGSIKVNGGNSSIGYTPATAGQHTITLNVSDAHGQAKTTTFTVTANEPEIAASVNSPNTYKTRPIEVVLNLDKPNYTGTFSTTVQQSGSGTLTLSGGGSTGGTLTLGKGATRFTYTPNTTGTHTITFVISASDGKTKTVTTTIAVTESPISFYAEPNWNEVQAGESESANYRDINLQISRSYYQGNLKLTLEKVTVDQNYPTQNTTRILLRTMMLNNALKNEYIGESSGNQTNLPINQEWTESVSSGNGKAINVHIRCFGLYTPGAPSNTSKKFTLHFKATDDNGQSETATAVVYVNLP